MCSSDLAEVRAMFVPGNKVRLHLSEGNPNNKLMHSLAIVDDDWVVYKILSKHKPGKWYYQVESLYLFELYHRNGHLEVSND